MAKYPQDLLTLIASFKKLPGVGGKTAERFAFHVLDWEKAQLAEFSKLLGGIQEKVLHCPECFCLTDTQGCFFCGRKERNPEQLCIVATSKDVFALEETRSFHGLYHVLGGLLSPLDQRSPEELRIAELKKRLSSLPLKEVILALDSTLEGDTTALYLKEALAPFSLPLSRLAFGLPMGSSLDFIDGGTLSRALAGRLAVQ